jgi:hypothetical protein
MSWSWTVVLPSDTHRKHVISITAVLLPFVTYLLTLPRIYLAWRLIQNKGNCTFNWKNLKKL